MALHRKQRGMMDAAPQYVRIPASRASGQTVGYSLHETHLHAQRVYAKRYAPSDRSRKISSLQLRACFALCVLLYFGAIYFADDIASLGRVVGSEQNSQSFFVHSLRPRGRSHMRVGRAVDAKKVEATTVPTISTEAVEDGTEEQQQDDPLSEVPEVETMSPEAEGVKTEEALATEPLEQPETEGKTMHQDAQRAQDDEPGDAVHPDDQGEDAPTDPVEDDKLRNSEAVKPKEKMTTAPTGPVASSEVHLETPKQQQEPSNVTSSPKKHTAGGQPHPTAPLRHPEKEGDVDAIPAASPARGKTQHVPSDVNGNLERQVGRDRKPREPVDDEQPAETTQTEEKLTEHTSDI
ncbi:hypothetical protein PRIC1_004720 [Phytophthora ramorum]|uniref:Transmembrane protein n=1 Tax=Phytophthora ramorum TaxID=164328 RepID=H3GDH6_PHYRM|nr:hypothetical protein KRP23_4464 [Phytophthora ramorum]KAH7507203.1 hypothetical protein KRP22_2306 [Phytophthora ramorum]